MVLYHLKITRLTRAKKGGEIGNKHQVGIRSARTELDSSCGFPPLVMGPPVHKQQWLLLSTEEPSGLPKNAGPMVKGVLPQAKGSTFILSDTDWVLIFCQA